MHCGNYSTTCCYFKDAYQENKLNEEIDWGVSIRKNRLQEKDIILAEEPSELRVASKPKRCRRKCKCCKKKRKEIPLCEKLSDRITFNRDTATFKEYMNMLARPRIIPCPPPEPEEKKKKIPKICSPRCAHLALPLRQRMLLNWQDYYCIFTPEQILWLKKLLTTREALLPSDAINYFKNLDKLKRKQKKLKKKKAKKQKIEKPKKSKVLKEISCLSNCIIHFFADKSQMDVKWVHIILSNLMKDKLEENSLIQPGYRRDKEKDMCGRTLFETLDQLAVWLESNICYVDDESEEEGEGEESTISSFSSDEGESIVAEEMRALGEGEGEGDEAYRRYGAEMEKMASEMGEQGVEKSKSKVKFREEGLAAITEMGEDEVVERLTQRASLEEGEEFGSAEEAKPEEDESKQEYEVEPKQAYKDESEDQSGEEITDLESLLAGKLKKAPSDGALATVASLLNEIIARTTTSGEISKPVKIEEHSPDAMCCVTLKTWATWLVDVAQNTHNWCQWIQDVIGKVRFFAAVIKGEVKTPDGKKRVLYKEEWQHFTETLAKDIEAWREYNKHVKDLSDKIIAGFQNKRVICCPACLKSKLIISEETAHQVTEQLVEALNTTGYWRGWLDAIVAEAKKLAALDFELPSITQAQEPSVSSGSYTSSSLVYEIVEYKSPSTKSSSDTSVFLIEELDKDSDKHT